MNIIYLINNMTEQMTDSRLDISVLIECYIALWGTLFDREDPVWTPLNYIGNWLLENSMEGEIDVNSMSHLLGKMGSRHSPSKPASKSGSSGHSSGHREPDKEISTIKQYMDSSPERKKEIDDLIENQLNMGNIPMRDIERQKNGNSIDFYVVDSTTKKKKGRVRYLPRDYKDPERPIAGMEYYRIYIQSRSHPKIAHVSSPEEYWYLDLSVRIDNGIAKFNWDTSEGDLHLNLSEDGLKKYFEPKTIGNSCLWEDKKYVGIDLSNLIVSDQQEQILRKLLLNKNCYKPRLPGGRDNKTFRIVLSNKTLTGTLSDGKITIS